MSDAESRIDRDECRRRLDALIGQSVAGIHELGALLDRETEALERQDAPGLEAVAADKAACVRGLDALEIERRKLASSTGFGIDGDGMQALLDWCGGAGETLDRWQELLEVAARCERQNRKNGAISHIRQEQIRAAIAVLSGNLDDSQQVYDPAGRGTSRTGHHRELARA